MYDKFFDLQFIIGAFFSIAGLIIFSGSFFTSALIAYGSAINLYSGASIFIFGLIMLLGALLKKDDQPTKEI